MGKQDGARGSKAGAVGMEVAVAARGPAQRAPYAGGRSCVVALTSWWLRVWRVKLWSWAAGLGS